MIKKHFIVPENVEVDIQKLFLSCKGPLGNSLLEIPVSLSVDLQSSRLIVSAENNNKKVKPLFGTFCSHLKNCLKGVHTGHSRQLDLVGVGYRIEPFEENEFSLKLGYSNKIVIQSNQDTEIQAVKPTIVQVKGTNIQKVTQKAADIRSLRRPEPYKGKGILYRNEVILRKEGKKLS